MSPLTPEQRARQAIDQALLVAGWQVQDEEDMNLGAGQGVAVREFPMAKEPRLAPPFPTPKP